MKKQLHFCNIVVEPRVGILEMGQLGLVCCELKVLMAMGFYVYPAVCLRLCYH